MMFSSKRQSQLAQQERVIAPAESTQPQPEVYPMLDVGRGLACLWVVFLHINSFYGYPFAVVAPLIDQIVRGGFLGVDFFFVLSGFLITGLLIPELKTGIRWKRFYIRRFFKIVPQYIVLVTFSIFMYCGLISATIQSYDVNASMLPSQCLSRANQVPYFIFMQNYGVIIPPLGHTWSLDVEEHFYLFYPLMLLAVVALVQRSPLKNRITTEATLIIIFVLLLIVFNMIRFIFLKPLAVYDGSGMVYFEETHFRVDAILFGCLLRVARPKLDHWLRRKAWKNLILIVSCALLAVLALGDFDRYSAISYTSAYLAGGGMLITTYDGKLRIAQRLSQIPGLQWIGKRSYAIYLWHYPVIYLFGVGKISVWFCLLAVLGAGVLSNLTIERFALRVRRWVAP